MIHIIHASVKLFLELFSVMKSMPYETISLATKSDTLKNQYVTRRSGACKWSRSGEIVRPGLITGEDFLLGRRRLIL